MKKKYLLVAITAAITVCLIRLGMIFFNTDYSRICLYWRQWYTIHK